MPKQPQIDQYSIIGGQRSICPTPVQNEDERFQELWKEHEARVRFIAHKYAIAGVIGADVEDLMEHAQVMMLQAIRTLNPAKARFNTYFYTLLNNHFSAVKLHFPRIRVTVHGVPKRGKKVKVECRSLAELEATVVEMRASGYALRVCDRTPPCKRANVDKVVSMANTGPEMDDGQDKDVAELSMTNLEDPRSHVPEVREMVNMIRSRIKEKRLRKIALLLFFGHEQKTIEEQMGIKRWMWERDMARIRMILRSEFPGLEGQLRRS